MNSFIVYKSEYEHLLLLLILGAFFILGLHKRDNNLTYQGFRIDKQFSSAIKGMACVMILMSHYETMMHLQQDIDYRGIAYLVGNSAANIALVWFMFISGYGMTVSKSGIKNHISSICERCYKVLAPCIFIYITSLVLYLFMPGSLETIYQKTYAIPQELFMFKGQTPFDLTLLISAPFKWYWFVWCILVYYLIFYASDYFSQKYKKSSTYFLIGLLTLYYLVAFYVLGPTLAHYYRLTWAFLLGHLLACWSNLPKNIQLGGGIIVHPYIF